jgi:hypothetical protein
MRNWWSFLVAWMVVLSLGMAQVPRVCMGDGHGGACRYEACACVKECSCQFAHEQERRAADEAGLEPCCLAAEAPCHTKAVAGCHGPRQFPNFAPPQRHWYGLVASLSDPLAFLAAPDVRGAWAKGHLVAWTLAPPERPPRSFA